MRKFVMFAMTSILLVVGGLAWAQKAGAPRRPLPVITSAQGMQGVLPYSVSNYSVTPLTITLPTSSNPDGSVSDTGSTTVSFKTTGNPGQFTVSAKAVTPRFTGCNSPLASRVTVACSSPSGVTCAAAAALSDTGNGTTLATGSGNHNPAQFHVTYTFQDDWSYQVGSLCSLSVQYIYSEL